MTENYPNAIIVADRVGVEVMEAFDEAVELSSGADDD